MAVIRMQNLKRVEQLLDEGGQGRALAWIPKTLFFEFKVLGFWL